MKKEIVNVLGMKLEQWTNKGCVAHFGIGKDWATLYEIKSKNERRGEATELLIEAKALEKIRQAKMV